jgi:hypothetical protein
VSASIYQKKQKRPMEYIERSQIKSINDLGDVAEYLAGSTAVPVELSFLCSPHKNFLAWCGTSSSARTQQAFDRRPSTS